MNFLSHYYAKSTSDLILRDNKSKNNNITLVFIKNSIDKIYTS